jgi:hypothetical protein
MSRRPNLIASVLIGAHALIVPTLIVVCALVVMGGIATGLSATGGLSAPVAFPIIVQETATPAPTIATGGTGPVTITIAGLPALPATNPGAAAHAAVTGNTSCRTATVPSPTATGAGAERLLWNDDMVAAPGEVPGSAGTGLSGLGEASHP